MWEKLSKVSVQVIVAVVSVLCINAMGFLLFFKGIPQENRELAINFIGQLQGAIVAAIFGWLYTQSKSSNKPPTP